MFAVHSVYAGMFGFSLVYMLAYISTVHYCKITKISVGFLFKILGHYLVG